MDKKRIKKLWRLTDNKGDVVYTRIPQVVLRPILTNKFKLTLTEIRVFLFIARMTFGMKNYETYALSLGDFNDNIGIRTNHVSTALKVLIEKKLISRAKTNSTKYLYSIKTNKFGMKGLSLKGTKNSPYSNSSSAKGNKGSLLGIQKVSSSSSTPISEKSSANSKTPNRKSNRNSNIYSNIAGQTSPADESAGNKPASSSLSSNNSTNVSQDEMTDIYTRFTDDLKNNFSVDTIAKYFDEMAQRDKPYLYEALENAFHDNYILGNPLAHENREMFKKVEKRHFIKKKVNKAIPNPSSLSSSNNTLDSLRSRFIDDLKKDLSIDTIYTYLVELKAKVPDKQEFLKEYTSLFKLYRKEFIALDSLSIKKRNDRAILFVEAADKLPT